MNEDQVERLLTHLENISASMAVLELCADAIMAAMPENDQGQRTFRVGDLADLD